MTWIESRLFEFSFVLRGSFFHVFFSDSLGRKVWPFSGPTGSVTADQISTGRVRFLASVSGTTFLVFFRSLPWSRAHDSRRPGISVVCSEWTADRRRIVIVCVRKNL